MEREISVLGRRVSYATIALLGILLGGLALRLVLFTGMARNDDLDMAHLAVDVLHGRLELSELLQQSFSEQGWRMAIYYPVAALYGIFGASEATTLAYPLISSILGILFIYLIGNLFAGQRAGLVAAFLWSIFPLDIHFATDLMPDGPMNAYSLGALYFFFRALRTDQKKLAAKLALISLGFLVWSVLVKPWAITLLLFMALHMALRAIKRLNSWNWWKEAPTLHKKFLTISAMTVLVAFASWFFVSNQQLDLLAQFWLSSRDLALWLFGLRQDRFIVEFQITDLMLLWTPLLLISTIWAVLPKQAKYRDLLLWAAFLYAYLEWGVSRPSLNYEPIHPIAESRNFLILLPPLILLAGIFLSEKLKSLGIELRLLAISLLLPVVALVVVNGNFSTSALQGLATSIILSLCGFLALLHTNQNQALSQSTQLATGIWLACFALGSLYPTLPEHFTYSYFKNQRDLQVQLQTIADYLRVHDDYPIVAFSDDVGLNLNYISGLDFGYNINRVIGHDEDFRIIRDQEAQFRTDSFYIAFYSDYRGDVPPNWWKIAEYTENVPSPVYFYRALSSQDAQKELAAALQRLDTEPSLENYTNLYGAASNALALPELMRAWQQIQALGGSTPELQELMPLVEAWVEKNPEALSRNLLPEDMTAAIWEPSGENVEIEVTDTKLDQRVLQVTVEEKEGQPGAISTTLELEPETLYMMTIVLRTDAHTGLLNIDGGAIPDSDNARDIHSNLLTFTLIFITPDWESASRPVSLELVHDIAEGHAWIREARLVKVTYVASEESSQ